MATNHDVHFVIARIDRAAKFAAPDSKPGGTLDIHATHACRADFQTSENPFTSPPTGNIVPFAQGDNSMTLKTQLAGRHYSFTLAPSSTGASTMFYVGVKADGEQNVGAKIEQDAHGNYQFCPRAVVKRPPGTVEVEVLFELENVPGPVDLRIDNATPTQASVTNKQVLKLTAVHPAGSKQTTVTITFDQPLEQTGGGSNGEIIIVEP